MRLVVCSPYDQSVVADVPFHDDRQIRSVLDRAERASATWRSSPLEERIGLVRRGLDRLAAQRESIARDITRQMGKPITQSQNEFTTMMARAEQALRDAPQALAAEDRSGEGIVRRIEHQPLGIVFDIGAWNYPLLIPINVIVPALLAGNVVVLKHSARTPLTGQAFAAAFGSLEVADLVIDVVISHEQTRDLISDPRIAHVAFTGSVAGGRQVYQWAAARLIDAGLELGGKDPAYVAEDADLAKAIDGIVDGACYNAGQSCCAVERVYVHRSRYDEFLTGCHEWMGRYVLGDPLDESTTMGPLALPTTLDLMDRQIADAIGRGARVLHGGHRRGGQFYWPTLLADVPNESEAMQEETFGPLLPVQAVADDQQAVQRMNESRFGLTASVWTTDQERAERLAQQLSAGTIFQNRCDYIDPSLPWTGWGESGIGSTLSRFGFYQLTRRKAIHFRS